MIPGEYHVASEPIDYNGGYEAISLEVKNVGDRKSTRLNSSHAT